MAKRATKIPIDPAILDQLLAGQEPVTILTTQGMIGDLTRVLAKRSLQADIGVHLGGEAGHPSGIYRNGSPEKTVLSDDAALTLSIHHDRNGRFDPALIA